MSCFHGYDFAGGEEVFAVESAPMAFGPGALLEAGPRLLALGARRVALFTDARVVHLLPVREARASLEAAGIDAVVFDEVEVEPTDVSVRRAAEFAREGRFDGYLSVGGGSVIDTAKAAALLATHAGELHEYVNIPVGGGRAVPGALPPHIACPTTTGTGSEQTGIAVFDLVERRLKSGIASRFLRPSAALVDPRASHSLPPAVVAASGFDVLCHALESYTARPFTARTRPGSPSMRPMSQGRNPWSDLGSLEALRLCGRYLARAVADGEDRQARESMAWAATLAGIAFGNAGVHLPHAISYAVAGQVRDYRAPGYPGDHPLVPHGFSVVVSAPSVFRVTAAACPERHLAAATALGVDVRGARAEDAGEVVAAELLRLGAICGVPAGLAGVGYASGDLPALAAGALAQKRLVDNSPISVDQPAMEALLAGAMDWR